MLPCSRRTEFWSGLWGGENSSSELDMSGLPPSRGESWFCLLEEELLFSVFSLRNRGQHHMVKKKKSVRWREGSWKKERAIVQSVTDPNGVLPSHTPPQSPGGKRGGLRDLRKVMLGPFLFQNLESQISRADLKRTKIIFKFLFQQLLLNTYQGVSTTFRSKEIWKSSNKW